MIFTSKLTFDIPKIITAINNDGKFFEVKASRPDNYWNPMIDTAKSRRYHD